MARVFMPGPSRFKVFIGLEPPGGFLFMLVVEPHSSGGTEMGVEPCVELKNISQGEYQTQSDVHTCMILETISSRRNWAMCVVVLLADGLGHCDDMFRSCFDKGSDVTYSVGDVLRFLAELCSGCDCRILDSSSMRLRQGQTMYNDKRLGVVYSFGDATCLL